MSHDKITHSIHILRRREDVFTVLADPERHESKWRPEVIEFRQVNDGPVGAGTRYQVSRQLMGRRSDATVEILRLEPPHLGEFRGTAGPFTFWGKYVLESADGGTRIDVEARIGTKGAAEAGASATLGQRLLNAAYSALLRAGIVVFRREIAVDFRRLKRLIEAPTANQLFGFPESP
ncbi:SRPBCC family protein [Myxococcus sp. AM009]|uniref:SRPBCC family protein n=1 Tax=unclassified Myxococcus TaxID=2648731 RepID=UPI001595E404|nr:MULTISPECIES: SRPBCC family protein [unclassified Myxococcus]NVI97747.1 SRPBCC family protein [Myxococcus sp. AM009]NVJ15826.1 SRPBCC family protein [Myxococcus sp. AM010]